MKCTFLHDLGGIDISCYTFCSIVFFTFRVAGELQITQRA